MNETTTTGKPSQAALAEFGRRLRMARIRCGLTQVEVARQIGVSKGYISRLEAGKTRPAEPTVRRLARVCATDAERLLTLAGTLPGDIRAILVAHPTESLAVLRKAFQTGESLQSVAEPSVVQYRPDISGKASYELVHGDCIQWMKRRAESSIHAIVTDPPYGLKEYSTDQQAKLRGGKGGMWRMPPALDGCVRRPVPRFTVLNEHDRQGLSAFFREWGRHAFHVLVPGGHIFVAANPLLSHLVYTPLIKCGFEKRGEVIRLVQTLRGGDRPKNAHEEFRDRDSHATFLLGAVGIVPKAMRGPRTGQPSEVEYGRTSQD